MNTHKTKLKGVTKVESYNQLAEIIRASGLIGNEIKKLKPVDRRYLKIGDIVKMKDGINLTVKSLEYRAFVSEEKVGYIAKIDIDTVLE